MTENKLSAILNNSIRCKQSLLSGGNLGVVDQVFKAVEKIARQDLTVRIIADTESKWAAHHLNEELVVRFKAGSASGREDREAINSRNYSDFSGAAICNLIDANWFNSATDLLICFVSRDNEEIAAILTQARNKKIKTFLIAIGNVNKLAALADFPFVLNIADPELVYPLQSHLLHAVCEKFEPDYDSKAYCLKSSLTASLELDSRILGNQQLQQDYLAVREVCDSARARRKSFFLAGNGGSACDINALLRQIRSGPIANNNCEIFDFHCPGALLAAINDGYLPFARQIEANGRQEDVLIVYSTSGNSRNLIDAVQKAKAKKLLTVALLGKGGGLLKTLCDYSLVVPDSETARIQESHALFGFALLAV